MKGAHSTQLSVQTAERAVCGPSFAPLPRLTSVFGACEMSCKPASAYFEGLTASVLQDVPCMQGTRGQVLPEEMPQNPVPEARTYVALK